MESGSELHRLKPMEKYDEELFNKLYKSVKPLVRKLANNVDERRFNVSKDIIQSYFWDKFIYVFNKYQGTYDENRLKANLINSLIIFKNRLLKSAYNNQSDFFQNLNRLDDAFENERELIDDYEETHKKEELLQKIDSLIKHNVSGDAYLVYQVQLNPPPYIRDRLKHDNSNISIVLLLDFFGLPRTKANSNFISRLRSEIETQISLIRNSIK